MSIEDVVTDPPKLQSPAPDILQYLVEHPELTIPKPPSTILQLPGFLGDVNKLLNNEYIKAAIIANPNQINSLINEYGAGYKPYIMTYLQSTHPDIHNAIVGGKEASGRENRAGLDKDKDDIIPKERWSEILDVMVEMDNEGISPGRISDVIYDDYGIELTHQQIWQYIERYRRSLKEEEKQNKLRQTQYDAVANRWKKINDEMDALKKTNIELEKKQAVNDALKIAKEPVIPVPVTGRNGLLTRFFRWAI